MDRNEIYTGKARLVNRGNGIVLRCATKGELRSFWRCSGRFSRMGDA